VGLTPQAKAEYSEARGDQAAREGVLVNRAKVLRSGIADAVISGDQDTARDLIRQAKSFDEANPAFAVLPDIENAIDAQAQGAGDLAGDADADRHQSEGQGGRRADRLRQH
jgi:hypothetical protein